jgi:L-histidine N-alpha-methyltransferase
MLLRPEKARNTEPLKVEPAFREDVIAGLSQRPRTIPARWFYDLRGSAIFEKITALPEYYLTRAEREILAGAAREIATIAGSGRAIIEFGSGSSAKTSILLPALGPSAYVPIDISGDFLRASVARLRTAYPTLHIHELEGDFTRQLALPTSIDGVLRLGFFLGSTIGNLIVPAAVDVLRAMASTLGEGSMLLIGIDRTKDPDILVAAYDDAKGLTADFNLNLLHRINRELFGTIPVDAFGHLACWNKEESRIEMHLQAQRDVAFLIDGEPFSMLRGETIHTENSLKYSLSEARLLLRSGNWTPLADWTDHREFFSLILAEVSSSARCP